MRNGRHLKNPKIRDTGMCQLTTIASSLHGQLEIAANEIITEIVAEITAKIASVNRPSIRNKLQAYLTSSSCPSSTLRQAPHSMSHNLRGQRSY